MIRFARHHQTKGTTITKPRGADRRSAGAPLVAMGCVVALAYWLAISSPGSTAGASTYTPNHTHRPLAHAARTISATDTANLSWVKSKSKGSHLYEEGEAHGTLPGKVIANANLGPPFTANVTIYTSAWSIRGHGTATPHASGLYESFAGTLTVTGGTGRYAHAHGHAGLYGVFNRRTYDLKVQTTGSLSY
jgi:hypothetical protein